MTIEREWYTTEEAARELGLTPSSIRGAAKKGTIKVETIAPRVRAITREEVERYRREHLGRNWDGRRAGVVNERNAAYHRNYRTRKKAEKTQAAANTASDTDAPVDSPVD